MNGQTTAEAVRTDRGKEPAIVFDHMTKRFGETVAVDGVSLSVAEGEFVTVVGSSGCGKTTLLKSVNALVLPDEGRVLVRGRATTDTDPIALRRSIGYVIQGSVLFPHLNVEQNIAYVPRLLGRGKRGRVRAPAPDFADTWLDLVGLPRKIKDRYPSELSGGQAQRVGLARALAAKPGILLADEPFSAVDAITRASLQDELKRIRLRTGVTVLFVTHDVDEALDLGDRVLVMEKGRAVQCAAPREVQAHPASAFVEQLIARRHRALA
ncbi:MAG TPA: ABC transporter ATP-binding protein [Candidatus Rubneribacter avistercoris]|nr:ABC transporter ATP-binding protein [Candidatus Rubneribacter avistercoris]